MPELQFFKASEFACKCGCGANAMNQEFLLRLDNARKRAGVPFVINSAYRCEAHNKAVVGVKDSAHTKGLAVDILAPTPRIRFRILKALLNEGFERVGIYPTFIHVDADWQKDAEVTWLG